MDERRRTISSEEQMIGEALMRVSNTLEAQRLTKSLDYQEKLRSRSNIRLIIAIICLFVAMMMMVISGALLFVLWRYADPVLDTVVPFLKNVMGDFGIIWDGLVESLTYVPVMVEQLTRLLEQVIVMLEGINQIDLAGMMNYLSQMLGVLVGMMTGLDKAMAQLLPGLMSMMDTLGDMLQGLAIDGLPGLIEALGIDPAAIEALMAGLMQFLDSTGKLLVSGSDALVGVAEQIDPEDVSKLVGAIGDMMGDMTQTLSEVMPIIASSINASDIAALMDNMGALLGGTNDLLGGIGTALGDLGETLGSIDIEIDPDQLQNVLDGMGSLLEGTSIALGNLGEFLGGINIDTSSGLWQLLGLLGISFN